MNISRQSLPSDCLLAGRIHPSIAERLKRIQQLPVAAVTNLVGVRKEAENTFLIWQLPDGRCVDQLEMSGFSQDQRRDWLRQLQCIVAAMHAHGIVHGAISPVSVLLDDSGNVHLTHVSPLLFDDPTVDIQALVSLEKSWVGQDTSQPSVQSAHPLRSREMLFAGALFLFAALIFVSLLWYSQSR